MAQVIPLVPSIFSYRFGLTILDAQYIFDVRWNGRDEAWYFDLLTSEEVMIRAGSKILLGTFPASRSRSAEFPDGVFMAFDTAGSGIDATFEDLGVRVVMYFFTYDELEEIGFI